MKTTKSLIGTTLLVLTNLLRETVAQGCTFCFDGSDLKDEFLENDRCKALNSTLPIDPDSFQCKEFQVQSFVFCGCDTYPVLDGGCPLCADGSSVSEDFRNILIPPDGPVTTCSNFEVASTTRSSDGECAQLQQIGFYQCGCPTLPSPAQDPCQLCPDSWILQNNDTVVQDGNFLTCEQQYKGASSIPAASEQCGIFQTGFFPSECCRAPEQESLTPTTDEEKTDKPTNPPERGPTQTPTAKEKKDKSTNPTTEVNKDKTLTPTTIQKKNKKGKKPKKNKNGKKKSFKRF